MQELSGYTKYQDFLSQISTMCDLQDSRSGTADCLGSSQDQCSDVSKNDPNTLEKNPTIRDETNPSAKAVKLACLGLFTTDRDWVGGPSPFLIASKDSTDNIVSKVKPLNEELAQAIADLHTGTQKITRDDLPKECNPTCGPCTDPSMLGDLNARQCFSHPQELHVSTESANQFISKAKTLLESNPELEPKTEESTSSFVVPTLIVLAIAVVGIASFKLYSQMKKQEEKKVQ